MALSSLINSLKRCSLASESFIRPLLAVKDIDVQKNFVRNVGSDNPFKYKKGLRKRMYRRIVHYPEDKQYTTDLLKVTRLGGRDPKTGRVFVPTIGGGIKYKYHWVIHNRGLQEGDPDITERVFDLVDSFPRTSKIALVGHDDKKRWITATENMKIGDLIKTSSEIPRIPVRPNEGDCYRLGALPVGTIVNTVEMKPNIGGYFGRAAGTYCTIVRKFDGKVLVQIPSKREMCVSEKCYAVVGRVSNIHHNKEHIGSPNRLRHLGYRPRSGLWHRKDGYCGRKINRPPPVRDYEADNKKTPPLYYMN